MYVVNEENHLEPMPWHHAVNEGYGLGISLQGAYRRRVRGTEQVVDSNTGFLRFAGDEVGVEHFVGGPGAITFVGIDPGVCPGFEHVAQVPAFTVTPEMALDAPTSRARSTPQAPTTSPSRRSRSTSSARPSSSTTTASTPIPGGPPASRAAGS